ncbi:hypothetical protein [Pediococcus inopinatus]|uniref:hypothetical protein n=1 Tax=Pediococcus inopinatus TaxID=114090 RepID=UPI0007C4FC54|nr:hypothetical protein [Pediococcus inopinatus]
MEYYRVIGWIAFWMLCAGTIIFTNHLVDSDKPKKYKKYTMVDTNNNLELFIDTLSYDEKEHIIMNYYLLNYPEQSAGQASKFAVDKLVENTDENTKFFLKQLLHFNRTSETPFDTVSGILLTDIKVNMTAFKESNHRK